MAIEMLENNELSALAPSRLGMKNFVNDRPMSGKKYANIEGNFVELFGSQKRKKKKLIANLKGQYAALSQDCDKIDASIESVMADVEAEVKKSATYKGKKLKTANIKIEQGNEAVRELKKVKAANCGNFEAERMAQEEKKFEEKLISLSESSIAKAKGEAESLGEKVKSNKNILLIGGGIVVLGIVSYFIFGKK